MKRLLQKIADYLTFSSPTFASDLSEQDNMGLGGSVLGRLPVPKYSQYDAAQQNIANAQNLWAAAQAQYVAPKFDTPIMSGNPLQIKMQKAIEKFCEQIPLKVANHITAVHVFDETKDTPVRIAVCYNNQRESVFYDVDNFPSDEHIARVMLECP